MNVPRLPWANYPWFCHYTCHNIFFSTVQNRAGKQTMHESIFTQILVFTDQTSSRPKYHILIYCKLSTAGEKSEAWYSLPKWSHHTYHHHSLLFQVIKTCSCPARHKWPELSSCATPQRQWQFSNSHTYGAAQIKSLPVWMCQMCQPDPLFYDAWPLVKLILV